MPERSFGRSIRYRRTKLGLSQAKLGELVGRSASTIRSWERDASTPSDASVVYALAAVLDLDERSLFEKAGLSLPAVERHPTVEEALASLSPTPGTLPPDRLDAAEEIESFVLSAPPPFDEPVETLDNEDVASMEAGPETEPEITEDAMEPGDEEAAPDVDADLEAQVQEHIDQPEPEVAREPEEPFEPFPLRPEPVGAAAMRPKVEPSYMTPPEPFQFTAPTPPLGEPSYLEDADQVQLYRVRNLATVVLVVALVIVFLWSLGNAVDAFGQWWEEFFGVLRF